MSTKKIIALSIADYDRSPDIFQKHPYCPGFGPRSLTWIIFYFYHQTPRKKIRVFESYGRTEQEALTGLIKAKVKNAKSFKAISKTKYLELKKKKKR